MSTGGKGNPWIAIPDYYAVTMHDVDRAMTEKPTPKYKVKFLSREEMAALGPVLSSQKRDPKTVRKAPHKRKSRASKRMRRPTYAPCGWGLPRLRR